MVAGGEDVDERTERELDREVPRHEHPDNPERLGDGAVPCARKDESVDRSALWTHPFRKMPFGVTDGLTHREDLEQSRLGRRSHAEVGVDGLDDRRLVLPEESVQRSEVVFAPFEIGVGIGSMGRALPVEALGKGESSRLHASDLVLLGS